MTNQERGRGKHAVITAGGLLRRGGVRSAAGGILISDNLAQIFDAVSGEGGHAVLADTVDPEAAIFGEHVDRQIEDPIFVRAEQSGEDKDHKAGAVSKEGQALWIRRVDPG